MTTAVFDLAALTLGHPVVSAKGGKSIPLSYTGRPVVWMPDAQRIAFEPSSFGAENTSRVNLVMNASIKALEQLTALDERILQLAVEESVKIFGRPPPYEEARSRYVTCLKQSAKGYEPTWKTKLNISGKDPVGVWDTDRKRRNPPASWAKATVWPQVTLKSLWFMGNQFGCLFETNNLLVEDAAPQGCPF